jgi:hypothetical protein
MSRYVYDHTRPFGQRLVEVPADWKPTPRPSLAVHGVKAPFKSMADGRYYDDTRTYERELRARGFEVVGNERKPFFEPELPKMPPIYDDILQAEAQIARGEVARPEMIESVEDLTRDLV